MTEKSIHLPMVFHFHQPVDNFHHVIEDAFNKAYGPLIDQIYSFSDLKVTLHFSGNLLEWFLKYKQDTINKLKEMSRRGQIEIIGGGYYEPIFSLIPHRDKIAQMNKLSDLIRKEFGLDVNGAWLSERVWEPHFPSFLNEVGLKYVIVDDNHFRSTGITEEDTFYTYITEDEGKTLRIFPINEKLRYLTPWKPTHQSFDYLEKMADNKGDRIALLISDAEKMGVWGSTHEICYVDGHGHWDGDDNNPFIPTFFEKILKYDWIKSITLSDYMKKYPAKSLIYLPTASYDKMEEWVLPTEIRKNFRTLRKQLRDDENRKNEYQFLKGGFWRYYLVKYPESNNMHKKMLHVREKLIEIEEKLKTANDSDLRKKIKPKLDKAWDEIYKAQCNDCYWHGLFGGIYLQFLRFSVYTHLITAESIIDEIKPLLYPVKDTYITFIPLDFTKNSRLEVLIESHLLNVYVDPFDGGTIFELDYKPRTYNLLNTLTRWPEAYHEKDKIDAGSVITDRYKKNMLRVRIMNQDATLEELNKDIYHEFGDFIDGEFKIVTNEKNEKSALIELEKEGNIKDPDSEEKISCTILKRISVEENKIIITVKGKFQEDPAEEAILQGIIDKLHLAIDLPFFFNGDPNKFTWETASVNLEKTNKNLLEPFHYVGDNFKARDETYNLSFEALLSSDTNHLTINKFPIISFTKTDEGYKEIYQGVNLIPRMNLGKNFELHIELIIS